MDLWDIISAEWSLFGSIMKKDKTYWADRFSLISKIRNPYMHNREFIISKSQINYAKEHCKEILSISKSYYADNTILQQTGPTGV